jgi:hypothetical protein
MKPTTIRQTTDQTRLDYLRKAASYARSQFNKLIEQREYRYSHESHAVAAALEATQDKYIDLGTFGVEGLLACQCEDYNGPDFQYLNAGDSYDLTIVHLRGKFVVTTIGDIIERGLN